MRDQLAEILRARGVLNGRQACRLINGYGKDEYSRCYFSFKEKPKGTTGLGCRGDFDGRCKYRRTSVLRSLKRLPGAHSRKMRFYDGGRYGGKQTGRQTDVFRFFYFNPELFERRILRQTLLPYIGDPGRGRLK